MKENAKLIVYYYMLAKFYFFFFSNPRFGPCNFSNSLNYLSAWYALSQLEKKYSVCSQDRPQSTQNIIIIISIYLIARDAGHKLLLL